MYFIILSSEYHNHIFFKIVIKIIFSDKSENNYYKKIYNSITLLLALSLKVSNHHGI